MNTRQQWENATICYHTSEASQKRFIRSVVYTTYSKTVPAFPNQASIKREHDQNLHIIPFNSSREYENKKSRILKGKARGTSEKQSERDDEIKYGWSCVEVKRKGRSHQPLLNEVSLIEKHWKIRRLKKNQPTCWTNNFLSTPSREINTTWRGKQH